VFTSSNSTMLISAGANRIGRSSTAEILGELGRRRGEV